MRGKIDPGFRRDDEERGRDDEEGKAQDDDFSFSSF
jgi:hypothetical protein